MTFSIFNPCTGTSDQVDSADGTSRCGAGAVPDEGELSAAREARIAEIRALIEDIAEPAVAPASQGLHC
jgi:hypothetical protein